MIAEPASHAELASQALALDERISPAAAAIRCREWTWQAARATSSAGKPPTVGEF